MKKHILFLCALTVLALSCSKGESWDSGGASDSGYRSSSDASSGNSGQINNAGKITAGEWNDLRNWGFWGKLMNSQGQTSYSSMPEYWGFDTRGRVAVHVSCPDGSPAPNIPVKLYYNEVPEWEARTDNHGDASLWMGLYNMPSPLDSTALTLTVSGNVVPGVPVITTLRDSVAIVNNVSLTESLLISDMAEVAFIVDATGSMMDEIDFLKADLTDILSKVKSAESSVNVHTAAVFYRDDDDDYVTRYSDFSPKPEQTINFIKDQYADGGGDYPEAVHTALSTALQNLSWDSGARNRIAFLVLDAPAHHKESVIESLQTSIRAFAKNGIRIIPVTASGTDKSTEFMCRFFSIATGGTYAFITNDSGIGGEHIDASVGKYEVELLNDLLVRLIKEYIE